MTDLKEIVRTIRKTKGLECFASTRVWGAVPVTKAAAVHMVKAATLDEDLDLWVIFTPGVHPTMTLHASEICQ